MGFHLDFHLDFHWDFHWDFHMASWHVSGLLAMLALLLSQNVLKENAVLLKKKPFECNCKHRQETNTRQHNATLGHNEQETQIQKPNERINMVDSMNI